MKLIGMTFMAKTYEWVDEYGATHRMCDSKSLCVDEVLMFPACQVLVFITKNGAETEIKATELKIYE